MKATILLLLLIVGNRGLAQADFDQAMDQYWRAVTSKEQEHAIRKVLATTPGFEKLKSRLAKGPAYSSTVKRGFFSIPQTGTQLPPSCLLFVPYDYTPEKKYQVRFLLHGGVSNTNPDFVYQFVDTANIAYQTSQVIQVYPAAWYLAPWWSEAQFQNVNRLLTWIKRNYNIDEQGVRLSGISDGGIGAFYLANADITPWSCITPFIGSLAALQRINPRPIYMNNLSNRAFFVVNGGKDPIFKKENQVPYLNLLKSVSPVTRITMVDSAAHSMGWFPVLRDSINKFADRHRRRSFPDSLVWETESAEAFNRCHYIIIRKLTEEASAPSEDHNLLAQPAAGKLAFQRANHTGFILVRKKGNTVNIQTSGIARFTLLASPDHFDFSQPVVLLLNGREKRQLILKPDSKTLLTWYAADRDRTMLFGAEVDVTLR